MTDQMKARLRELAAKYLKNTASDTERAELENWFREQHDEPLDIPADFANSEAELEQRIFAAIEQRTNVVPPVKVRRLWPRIAAAASILIAIGAGAFIALHKQKPQQQIAQQQQKHELLPGSNKAILILSSGKQLVLNNANTGTIATQGATIINKTTNGQIVYQNGAQQPANTPIVYNEIKTPRGGQWAATLPDGTEVMLDAASSIKYPVAFNGSDREVTITGQVWFKVKHNAAQPFLIKVKGQTIRDIGTEFNVNAYDDEPSIRTTLIEGSVSVNETVLKPGQQAVITDGQLQVRKANIEQTIAWKNGLFNFDQTPLPEAMRQLARWYDVDIDYPQGTPNIVFNGEMHRNENGAKVLDVLRFFKVNFEVENGKIIVKP